MQSPKLETILDKDIKAAEEQVRNVLKEHGFGVITYIDAQKTFKEKLDIDFKPYVILGACNPKLAHQSLSYTDDVGLLLPCNIVLSEVEGGIKVMSMRPSHVLNLAGNKEVCQLAGEVDQMIESVFSTLGDE